MRHKKKLAKLNRPTDQRLALLRNLARELIEHGQIVTTDARAKAVASFVEKLITKAIRGEVRDLRAINAHLNNRDLVHHLRTEIVPKLVHKKGGGYTKVIMMPPRRGDGAMMSMVSINYEKS